MTRKQEHHENKVQPQFFCLFCLVLPITNLKTFVVLQMMNAKMPRKLGRNFITRINSLGGVSKVRASSLNQKLLVIIKGGCIVQTFWTNQAKLDGQKGPANY